MPAIKKLVESKGIKSFVFQVGGKPEEIFRRDYQQLKSSDLIIAEVSERSHGVGIEIGLSYGLGLRRILLLEKGQFVSKLAQGIPQTIVIEYENLSDLEEKLSLALDNM